MKKTLTKKDRARYSALIHELANLSRNGWANAKPCDYVPLETELAALNARMIAARL